MPNHLLNWDEIESRISKFVKRWQTYGTGNEKSEGHEFVSEFLQVFGIDWLASPGVMEKHLDKDGFSDFIWFGKIIIEMKSRGTDPGFNQATSQIVRYTSNLAEGQKPILWMACDFENFRIWNQAENWRIDFKLGKLRKHKHCFGIIAGHGASAIPRDKESVNKLAAEKMAKLHDELKKHSYTGQDLEIYLARLLFCLFANDTDIFHQDSFQYYIEASSENGNDLDARLSQLFQDLNEPVDKRMRNPYLSDHIDPSHFRHINGSLFEKQIRHATFDKKMRHTLLDCLDFDWGQISPAIFGSIFQGVMDTDHRREIGAHYTSEENIKKLIDPLFMNELRDEFEKVKKKANQRTLAEFHNKLASLKFLDPACGCGNFLMIAYKELRKLELEVVREEFRLKGINQQLLNIETHFKVNVEQFYGIEILSWPCQIAKTGMWLMDHLCNKEASDELGQYFVRIPLTKGADIVCDNAHRIDWEEIVPKNELSYILGNPPFVGYSNQNTEQKEDILLTCLDEKGKPIKNIGKIDYVAAWYYRASKYIQGTKIRVAFVSTNSITQGEQVAAVWKPLFDMFGIHIDFAYRTFKWSNEAKGKAAVHCVIIGFSTVAGIEKVIYDDVSAKTSAININPYLVDAPSVFVESRATALCASPELVWGNKPVDGGYLVIEDGELAELLASEPLAKKYIRQFIGSEEFINNKQRHCLWLTDASPGDLRRMPLVMERIDKVRKMRVSSPKAATRKSAETPSLFQEIRQPNADYAVIPSVSSEKRNYIPIGFVNKDVIVNNAVHIIPNATLYHFGILTSSVHMAWTRAVCGRLKSDYRYSKDIVYNNFPWPKATDKQKTEIERLAQSVLDARAKFPDSSLADLYDPLIMPKELLKAHRALDRAVMKLYGFAKDMSEPDIVAELMEMYKKLSVRM